MVANQFTINCLLYFSVELGVDCEEVVQAIERSREHSCLFIKSDSCRVMQLIHNFVRQCSVRMVNNHKELKPKFSDVWLYPFVSEKDLNTLLEQPECVHSFDSRLFSPLTLRSNDVDLDLYAFVWSLSLV